MHSPNLIGSGKKNKQPLLGVFTMSGQGNLLLQNKMRRDMLLKGLKKEDLLGNWLLSGSKEIALYTW